MYRRFQSSCADTFEAGAKNGVNDSSTYLAPETSPENTILESTFFSGTGAKCSEQSFEPFLAPTQKNPHTNFGIYDLFRFRFKAGRNYSSPR